MHQAKTNNKNLILTGLCIALGLIIPYITGHAAGIPGNVLLPMYLPVVLCGHLCGWRYGLLCGILTPALSSVLTGMPPLWPMLPIVMADLAVNGLISGLLYRKLKLPVFVSLPAAMLAGRCAYGLMFVTLTAASSAPLKAPGAITAIITGLPGAALQLIIIPVILAAAGRSKTQVYEKPEGILAKALEEIKSREYSCIVIKESEIIHRADGRGVKPLLDLYESENGREILKGACVADKIVGKAAAMILTLGKADYVYGEIMSKAAREYLEQQGINYGFGRCVEIISNRLGNGMCPIEDSVMHIDDPEEGLSAIKTRIKQLAS